MLKHDWRIWNLLAKIVFWCKYSCISTHCFLPVKREYFNDFLQKQIVFYEIFLVMPTNNKAVSKIACLQTFISKSITNLIYFLKSIVSIKREPDSLCRKRQTNCSVLRMETFLKMGVLKSTWSFNFFSNLVMNSKIMIKCSVACPTSENLFRITGLYKPPAILEEFCELLSSTKIDLLALRAVRNKYPPIQNLLLNNLSFEVGS